MKKKYYDIVLYSGSGVFHGGSAGSRQLTL